MDANKLLKLREIGYKILPTCDTCDWAEFREGSDFGACMFHSYKHAKHTDETMDLSIHRSGSCDMYEAPVILENVLGAWAEFLD